MHVIVIKIVFGVVMIDIKLWPYILREGVSEQDMFNVFCFKCTDATNIIQADFPSKQHMRCSVFKVPNIINYFTLLRVFNFHNQE